MRFIDEVNIQIESGHGGQGCVGYRREKYVPRGGPDGGDGGRGGHVYFIADEGLNTLVHFRGKRFYKAQNGESGQGSQRNGKAGEDLYLRVPIGTLIKDAQTGNVLADLTEHEQVFQAAQGGNGGFGNAYFKSSTNQTPDYAQSGEEGTNIEIKLELKLLADVALVGMPNAGKSTLISVISAAKPKIADYPFTTLEPNLGVVKRGEESLVVADVPGLIEKASEGKGLGIRFLKHIERTKAIVHLVDCSMCLEPFEAYENYVTIKNELTQYAEKLTFKNEITCLSKIDAMTENEIEKFINVFEEQLGKKVLPISSVSGRNIDLLINLMFKAIK